MAESTVKITINHYNCHTGFSDCFLSGLTCLKSWSCLQIGGDKSPPDCSFTSFCSLDFLLLDGLVCFCRAFASLRCDVPVQSFDPTILRSFLIIVYSSSSHKLIGGSDCSLTFQNPYPKKIMILISYITALSVLQVFFAQQYTMPSKRWYSFDGNRSLIQLAASSQLHYLLSPWLHQSLLWNSISRENSQSIWQHGSCGAMLNICTIISSIATFRSQRDDCKCY